MTEIEWPGYKLRDEHALAIGKVALAWNEFQDNLASLFAAIFVKEDWAYAIAAWQALENDRAQRRMLRAVAEQKLGKKHQAYKEIAWLVETAHQHLSNWRNSSLHTPFLSLIEKDGSSKMLPDTTRGNRRAQQMLGKNLLTEFSIYEANIRKMNTFCTAIRFHLNVGSPLPERPQLPALPQYPI